VLPIDYKVKKTWWPVSAIPIEDEEKNTYNSGHQVCLLLITRRKKTWWPPNPFRFEEKKKRT
jgi:hypothetical protein